MNAEQRGSEEETDSETEKSVSLKLHSNILFGIKQFNISVE